MIHNLQGFKILQVNQKGNNEKNKK